MASRCSVISAVGTPLNSSEELDGQALGHHLRDQFTHGATGLLVAGTMGVMQLLSDRTYCQLIDAACGVDRRGVELMFGAGDASFARTRDRIALLNDKPIDGIVVLSPYLFKLSNAELVDYFSSLADFARRPLFLYDLPGMTRIKLDLETVLTLAEHPNIHGIKCSGEFNWTRQLIDAAPAGFRVIVAQADLVDTLYRHGVREHLDGIFALAPGWVRQIIDNCQAGNWEAAANHQQRLSALLRVVIRYGVFPSFTALLNARGIPGNYAPRPFAPLSGSQLALLLKEPIVDELIRSHSGERGSAQHSASFQASARSR